MTTRATQQNHLENLKQQGPREADSGDQRLIWFLVLFQNLLISFASAAHSRQPPT